MLGGNREVTKVGNVVTGTNGIAVDARDHRLGTFGDLAVEVESQVLQAALAPFALFPVDITADTKGALASTGQHDHADLRIVAGLGQQSLHVLDGVTSESVERLGPIDGDGGNVIFDVVNDFLIAHGVSS